MKVKLFLIQDRVNDKWYWAFHTKNIIIETKSTYKTEKMCRLQALLFAKKRLHKLDSFEFFTCKETIKRV